MRFAIGLAVLLAGPAGALAQATSHDGGAKPSTVTAPAATLPVLNDDSRARQAAVDDRIAARTRRAMGSVCRGCDGPAHRPSRGRADAEGSEAPIRDPAQAPVD